jgi:hypothetical protein
MGFLKRLLGLELTGPVPGQSLANRQLQNDTFSQLLAIENMLAPNCRKKRKVVNTEVIGGPENLAYSAEGLMLQGRWSERWYLDRAGEIVAFDVNYSADGHGGTGIGIKLHQQQDGVNLPNHAAH